MSSIFYIVTISTMAKNKNKKLKKEKKLQKKLQNATFQEKMYDQLIDNKPMSQVIHWSLILSTAAVFGLKMADAAIVIENIGR